MHRAGDRGASGPYDRVRSMKHFALAFALVLAACSAPVARHDVPAPLAPSIEDAHAAPGAAWVREHYEKREVMIPMRDGVRLFTSLYVPRDRSRSYPILLRRTPYSCSPYGVEAFPDSLGPSALFTRSRYVFATQDVRGAYRSEGVFVDMRPKAATGACDETTDAWDTIDWLVKHVPECNGRVGMHGISYPGFYAAAGMIDAHPALKAVSPQAPIADWWYDDFRHHGALFLPHAFNFLASFGRPRPEPVSERKFRFEHGTQDGYDFFQRLGPLANANERHFKGEIAFWNDLAAHPNYDEFWHARNLLPRLERVAPAVLVVGGWFDAEDLYGPLQIYRSVEEKNPGVFNALVMGPWSHGGWARTEGDRLGQARFGSRTARTYREDIEFTFFERALKEGQLAKLPEASVFDTGANAWRAFDAWPPKDGTTHMLWFAKGGALAASEPAAGGYDEFVSDPARPVPFTQAIATGMTKEYMTEDQRFASRRPDVLTYRSDVLDAPLVLAGPIVADLLVSTSGTDADWIVKVIDQFPDDAPEPANEEALDPGQKHSGYQMLVRSEVIRGRFREDRSRPEPFTPNEATRVRLPLQDVMHTFKPGHRLVVQVQSTWFPLVDLNPQTYVENLFDARESDFVKATHRVFAGSRVEVSRLAR